MKGNVVADEARCGSIDLGTVEPSRVDSGDGDISLETIPSAVGEETASIERIECNNDRLGGSMSSTSESASVMASDVPSLIDKDDQYYPDGGLQAYLVILGSFFGTITSLGMVNSIGAIQAYVSIHQLADFKASTTSWIFSVYLALTYSTGLVAGPIFDHKGASVLLIIATLLTFAGLMGAANSSQMYQFILSFIVLGIGNGVALTPLIGVINHWFLRKRGFMTGVVTSGGSVGGLTFPLLLRYSLVKYDYVWALRILAFLCLGLLLVSCVLVKSRIYRTKSTPTHTTNTLVKFDIGSMLKKAGRILKKHSDKTFILSASGSFATELSLVLLLTYFVTYVTAQGYSESTGYLILTTWNATSILGRLLPGLGSDYLGKFNVNILMMIGYDLCIFIIWLAFGSRLPALYAFAGIGGFFSGSILGMIPACLAQITKVSEFGERYGILNFAISIGNLVGIPIGAAVIDNGSVKNYNMFVLLVGCIGVMGTILFYLARYSIVGFKLNIKV